MSNMKTRIQTNSINRRTLLKLGGAGVAIAMFTPMAIFAQANNTAIPSKNFKLFMSVSKALTGKKRMNQSVGQHYYNELTTESGFSDALLQLQPLPKGKPDQWSAQQQKTAKTILSVWYLGLVTQGKNTKLITYEDALMFEPVSDVLALRTYCTSRPGHWTNNPTLTT